MERGISKGEASDAIDYCVKNFPQREEEWQNRPATPEHIRKFEDYDEEVEDGLTYAEAKELIKDFESEMQQEVEEQEVEGIEISLIHDEMNDGFGDVYYRPVTLEEVKAAVDYLKQNKPGWSRTDVVDALKAILSDYRFNESLREIAVRYCLPCRGRIDIPNDQLGQAIRCPHCGHVGVFS